LLPRGRPWRRGEAAGRTSGSAEKESGAAPSRFGEAEEEWRAAACREGAAAGDDAFGEEGQAFGRAKKSIRGFLNFGEDVKNDIYISPEGVLPAC
jgi:hypothetical protein